MSADVGVQPIQLAVAFGAASESALVGSVLQVDVRVTSKVSL